MKKAEFEIPLSEFGIKKPNAMFDIKQLLCHLMGIASQKDAEVEATLLYLFFGQRLIIKIYTKE